MNEDERTLLRTLPSDHPHMQLIFHGNQHKYESGNEGEAMMEDLMKNAFTSNEIDIYGGTKTNMNKKQRQEQYRVAVV